MIFVWNDRNIDHIAKHGISPAQAEYLVTHARPPYPQMVGDDRRIVVGTLAHGAYVQVVYVPSRSVPGAVFVMHARPLTDDEKRKFRRRIR
jgi:uncharacterized DUF497 family protein